MRQWQAAGARAGRLRIGALALAALLAACGGGSDPAPVRGGVIGIDAFPGFTRAQIDATTAANGSQALTGTAACDVTVQRIRYQTKDPSGADATASTAVMVPTGAGANCSGTRPVVLYAHGTTTLRSFNMANVASNGEAALAMAMFAAQGFIVVAPNYLGYDTSSLSWHPYLNAEASAVDLTDALRAASGYLNNSSGTVPGRAPQVFVTGYSQGGHVAMAAHKVLERDYAAEFTVIGSGPMSGPYNLVTLGDLAAPPPPATPTINAGATIFVPLLLTSYQRSYGNVYTNPGDVYQAPFAATAESLFPTDTPVADLIAQGRLPADPTFTRLYGTGGLLTDAFRNGYFTSGYRAGLVRNTLLGQNAVLAATDPARTITWLPRAPVAMCGGANDPTVFFAPNGGAAQALFAAAGATNTVSYDVENRSTLPAGPLGDQIAAGFQAAKTAAGANAVAQYHGTLVPPFCTALVRAALVGILTPPAP